jgi:hypothetical protein
MLAVPDGTVTALRPTLLAPEYSCSLVAVVLVVAPLIPLLNVTVLCHTAYSVFVAESVTLGFQLEYADPALTLFVVALLLSVHCLNVQLPPFEVGAVNVLLGVVKLGVDTFVAAPPEL